MGRKKQGLGEESTARTTRASSRFDVLAVTEDDFPALISGMNAKNPDANSANKDMNPVLNQIAAKLTGLKEGDKPDSAPMASGSGVSVQPSGKHSAITAAPVAKAINPVSNATKVQVMLKQSAVHGLSSPLEAAVKVPEIAGAKIVGQNYMLADKPEAIAIPTAAGMDKKPWNTLFKDNRAPTHGIKLRFIEPKGSVLDFTNKVMPTMVEMWGHCLVGCFTGRFPGLKAVYELKEKWGVRCLVRPHDKGWIIFKFQNDADRMKVLNEGPYTIFGKLLMLKVLSEEFSFDDEEFLKVPIWVKLPNLPMQLWNEEAMSEVASMIGTPLTTDRITQERANHNFARVLVEVDVSKPPPLSFPIRLPSQKVFNQQVVYETFPNFCFHCKKYGHHPFICKELAEKELKEKNGKETNMDVAIIKVAGQDAVKETVEKRMEIEEDKLPNAQLAAEKILEETGNSMLVTDTVNQEVDDTLVEVYLDGKFYKIREDAKVDRSRMLIKIPGLSWLETIAKLEDLHPKGDPYWKNMIGKKKK
ncbi:unnamed protein product [Cuscuta epithymum]|uniref:DUF4283 domain-containing protein n=1 Tax=Cuscuta epithymum TaxID=186058 RepID=A0AAV0FTS8_9ASTE|nr:unnamed protein product [Cuscuta epithymum]